MSLDGEVARIACELARVAIGGNPEVAEQVRVRLGRQGYNPVIATSHEAFGALPTSYSSYTPAIVAAYEVSDTFAVLARGEDGTDLARARDAWHEVGDRLRQIDLTNALSGLELPANEAERTPVPRPIVPSVWRADLRVEHRVVTFRRDGDPTAGWHDLEPLKIAEVEDGTFRARLLNVQLMWKTTHNGRWTRYWVEAFPFDDDRDKAPERPWGTYTVADVAAWEPKWADDEYWPWTGDPDNTEGWRGAGQDVYRYILMQDAGGVFDEPDDDDVFAALRPGIYTELEEFNEYQDEFGWADPAYRDAVIAYSNFPERWRRQLMAMPNAPDKPEKPDRYRFPAYRFPAHDLGTEPTVPVFGHLEFDVVEMAEVLGIDARRLPTRTFAWDIETDNSLGTGLDPFASTVITISIADNRTVHVFAYEDEAELLQHFAQYLSTKLDEGTRLIGFNSAWFDAPYLVRRVQDLRRGRAADPVPAWRGQLLERPDLAERTPPTGNFDYPQTLEWNNVRDEDTSVPWRRHARTAGSGYWALKRVSRHLGMRPIELDRSRLAEYSERDVALYAASDALTTLALSTYRP